MATLTSSKIGSGLSDMLIYSSCVKYNYSKNFVFWNSDMQNIKSLNKDGTTNVHFNEIGYNALKWILPNFQNAIYSAYI